VREHHARFDKAADAITHQIEQGHEFTRQDFG
jgi:hypothetical protein